MCAAAAMELCAAAGLRGALLLPTLLLAEQQAAVLRALLPGRAIALATGATAANARRALAAALADPAAPLDVVVGTHALLDEGLTIARLGLVVVDEQQRFGVVARAALVENARRAGTMPHQLALSATPIPRTLALALRGALALGRLDESPPGRAPIATRLLTGEGALETALEAARATVAEGAQLYWVCPQIEGGPQRGVIEAAAWLEARLGRAVALCHGKQPAPERRRALQAFRDGAPVLCATTVVEVGLDVPGAALMVIEGPERLGLSALHQLRGRVGRGARRSSCLLCAPGAGEAERARLSILCETADGLQIAEADLRRRGMGDLAGVAQSGIPSLPPLPPDELAALIEGADAAAAQILAEDPTLAQPPHGRLRRALGEATPRRFGTLTAG
jgi:ATP-dependent DNA helicase RecG